MDIARRVTIVAPLGSSLGAAMQAALAARGWLATLLAGSSGTSVAPADDGSPPPPTLMVLEDDTGSTQQLTVLASGTVVCVGSISSLNILIPLATQGAVVLNQAAPFLVLIGAVEDALLSSNGSAAERNRSGEVAELLQRQAEAAALTTLTPAERDALRGMAAGLTVAEIAARSHRSVHTIRSQIKAVLAKLGVQAQITAVATMHRSGPAEWLGEALVRFHQFW